ncbi:MAG: M20/M25/M40 family metallo-hydrolase [Candidatus Paceibacterota bacterium]|jgi:acetylornithine deacetylase/succinyl-diaminopimelate desuccinylase-like protein
MIGELQKLIRFKTVVGNHKENGKALKWVRSELAGLDVDVREFESDGYRSIVITTQKTMKPKVFLAAHMDVAKASNDLFIPRISGDKLFGRGAYDMKFAIACYLRLLKELKKDLLKYDLGIMITSDEECGGKNGAGYLLGKGYGCDAVVLPDGSENWKIEKASKGVWCFVVKSYGKSAHPSMPWKGINAIEALLDYFSELQKPFKTEPCGDPLHIHSTIDINEFNTGRTGDNLPDYAEAMADIFFISGKEYEKIVRMEKSIRKKYSGIKLMTTIYNPSVRINIKNRFADEFYRIARNLYGIRKEAMFTHGTSDAHYFVEKNISVIETRPKGGDFHGDGEWIDLVDLERFYQVLKEFTVRMSAVDNEKI